MESAGSNAAPFLGLDQLQWLAVQTTAVVIQAAVLVLTALFAYRQLKQAARSAQFDAVNRMQSVIDDFRGDRENLFQSLPLSLALEDEQFAKKPPSRHGLTQVSEGQRRKMLLTDEQRAALQSLTQAQMNLARGIINRLNDLGELVEDGFIPKDVFFGKYHLMIIRCCHLVEPVRRHFEESIEGGNYGQRLLRLRYRAATYNDIMPKHRDVGVYIRNQQDRRLIYRSPSVTLLRRAMRVLRRWTRWY